MSALMWRLIVATIMTQTAIFVARPLLTYRVVEFGASELAIGALVVAFTLFPAVAALPLGRYCDEKSPTRVARGGTLLLIGGCVALALAPNLGWLLGATAVLGLGSLAVMVATQAVVARSSPRSRLDASFGLLTTAVSVGQMIGPTLGGLVMFGAEPRGGVLARAFVISAVLCVVALGLLWHRMEEPGVRREKSRSDASRWQSLLGRPTVVGGILASAAILSAVDLLVAYLPLIGERNGLGPATVGLLLSARAGASVLSRLFIPLFLRAVSPGVLLVVSLAASGVLLPVLGVVEHVGVMAAVMVAIGCFLGLGQPLTMSMLVRAVPATDQGAALSLRLSGTKVGQVVMAAVITGLTGVAGVSVALGVMGASLICAAAALRPNRRSGEP